MKKSKRVVRKPVKIATNCGSCSGSRNDKKGFDIPV